MHVQGNRKESVFEYMKPLERMWKCLREGVLFFIRPYAEGDGSQEQVWAEYKAASEAAALQLHEYACLAEEHFGHVLCTYNLHILICRLPRQQLHRGHAAYYREFWVERLMQEAKRTTKFRTVGAPELVVVSEMCWRLALDDCKAAHGGLRTFDELVPAWGGDPALLKGSCLDQVDGEGLLGSGVVVEGAALEEDMGSFEQWLQTFPDKHAALHAELGEAPYLVVRYKQAHRGGVEIIHSVRYERARTRASYYIRVRYVETRAGVDREILYIGRIRHFVGFGRRTDYEEQVEAEGGRAPQSVDVRVRFAVADLYEATTVSGFMGAIMRVADMDAPPKWSAYAVQLSSIDCKVLHCQHPRSAEAFFVPYTHAPWDNA